MTSLPDIEERYVINVGPQHPSTHGGIHVEALMEGEIVVDSKVHLGYVHRSVEKIAEKRTYMQYMPYPARFDYVATNLPVTGYCQAVEKLLGLEIPERAEYLRVIMCELSRIASHLLFIASLAIDIGATTGLLYCFRDRERVLDMFEMTSGQRLLSSYVRIGGVSSDLPQSFYSAVESFLEDVPKMIKEYHGLLTGNEIFQARLCNVGTLSLETAKAYGVSGPNLRASGLAYDIRRADPYSIYDRFDFDIPVSEDGDGMARYLLRVREIEESAKIIRQALAGLPHGDFKSGKVPKNIKPKAGMEAYHRIESSKGELGFYIISDGSEHPYRLHVRAPSFINLMVLPVITHDTPLQNLITNIATLDPVLGEADR